MSDSSASVITFISSSQFSRRGIVRPVSCGSEWHYSQFGLRPVICGWDFLSFSDSPTRCLCFREGTVSYQCICTTSGSSHCKAGSQCLYTVGFWLCWAYYTTRLLCAWSMVCYWQLGQLIPHVMSNYFGFGQGSTWARFVPASWTGLFLLLGSCFLLPMS